MGMDWTDPTQLAMENLNWLCDGYYRATHIPPPPYSFKPRPGETASAAGRRLAEESGKWDATKHVSVDPKRRDAIRQEINRRKAIPQAQWRLVDSGKLVVGLTQCAMLAELGFGFGARRTVTANGQTIQFVYPNGIYVYTNGTIVTGFQTGG